MSSNNMDFH